MIGCQGQLHIAQGKKEYILEQDKFLLLFPGIQHYGYAESPAPISYYYCHFSVNNDFKQIILTDYEDIINSDSFLYDNDAQKNYILPEYGSFTHSGRVYELFNQLVDYGGQNYCPNRILDCSLSLLMMELTWTISNNSELYQADKKLNKQLNEIKQWIRLNISSGLTVQNVARQFNYSPDYLSTVFRKTTGMPLLLYMHKLQISNAKKLLLSSSMKVREIANSVGFQDEKQFMKLFKRIENITPSEYRNTYPNAYLSDM
jgi:AraC-like DNA-binding protein